MNTQKPLTPRAQAAARVRAEGPIPLDEACKFFPAPNRRGTAAAASLLRWIVSGDRGPGGRVKLEAARVGGKWHTSVEAIGRFLQQRDGRAVG